MSATEIEQAGCVHGYYYNPRLGVDRCPYGCDLRAPKLDPYAASRRPEGLAGGSEGPPMTDLVEPLRAIERGIAAALDRMAVAEKKLEASSSFSTVQLDSNGDSVARGAMLMEVRQGRGVRMTRLTLDADGYDPGAPYSAANSYVRLYRNEVAVGNLLDFGPAAAGGPWLPGLFEMELSESPLLRSGERYVLDVNAGPASKRIGCVLTYVEYEKD